MLVTLHAQAKNSSAPNYGLEGDWVRIDTAGAGDFDGLNKDVPKAQLTPAAKAILAHMAGGFSGSFTGKSEAAYSSEKVKTGQATVVVAQPCFFPGGGVNSGDGTLTFDPDSGGFHLIVGRTQVVWTGERGGARVIWMDGRKLPNESDWTHPEHISVGHWENGVLVAKTVGLKSISFGPFVPGGGIVEPSTQLTERFELMPGGKQMKIVYTFWDPKLYVKPQTYTYTFDRALPPYALEDWCNPGNRLEYQSVVPPSQNLK